MAETTTTTLTRSESEGVTILRLTGPLTHETVPSVRRAFEAATNGAARVVVDLTDVPMLTTPGLSLLLTASRRLIEAGGRLVLTGTRHRRRHAPPLPAGCRTRKEFPTRPKRPGGPGKGGRREWWSD